MEVKVVATHVRGEDAEPTVEARRMLALLRDRLEEARGVGCPFLKLEPGDLEPLSTEAGIRDSKSDAFRVLVRQNLVRLRGRWRENHSASRAPVYVERITEQGLRLLAGSDEEVVDTTRAISCSPSP